MRPGFIGSFQPVVFVPTQNTWNGPSTSFEYDEGWPGTLPNANWIPTFTGFDTPTNTTGVESYEAAGGWPGT